ncbi:MAG TPA: tetratricopeptide repeat protein [Armatimonadota bacterium]|nr:tetratricopeptide repeat protein [Armatimonadota bacterium]
MTTTNNRFFHFSMTGPAYGRLAEAERFFLDGNLNEALAAAQQAWREHPKEPDVFRVLAYIHMARGEYPPAAQAAYQSVVLDGDNPASFASLAQVYVTFNMVKEAMETLTKAHERFPDDLSILVLFADLHYRKLEFDLAETLLLRILALNPQESYAKALLGTYRLKKRRYVEARDLLTDAVDAYPQRWDYLRDLGIALLHTGQYAEASDRLVEAFRRNPLDDAAKQHLWFALNCRRSSRTRWAVSLFFYDHATFGWLLTILGGMVALVSFGVSLSALHALATEGQQLLYSVALLVAGIFLVVMCLPGIAMHNRRGKKFDRRIQNAIDTGHM